MNEASLARRRIAIASIAAVTMTLAAVVAWQMLGADNPPVHQGSPADAIAFGWHANDRRAYDLAVDVHVTHSDAGASQASQTRLRAQLCLQVLATEADTARVAMQLRGIDRESAGQRDALGDEAMGIPFVVDFDGGMPVQIEFADGVDDVARSSVSELVRIFQATLPPPAVLRWSALEEHEPGRYRAAYQVQPDGAWRKRKAAYLPGTGAGKEGLGDQVQVLHSSVMLTPATNASWWQRAEANEDLEISLLGAPFVRVKMHSLLQARQDAFDLTDELARSGEAAGRLQETIATREQQIVATTPKTASPEERARFFAVVAAWIDGDGKDYNAVHSLAAILSEFPELAVELLPRLADTGIADAASAGLLHALELAGNDGCQDALGKVCSETSYPQANRKRAIIAIGGVKAASEAAVATLWELSATRDPDGGNDLANTALLALGVAGRNLQGSDAERSAEVSFGLQKALSSAAPDGKAVVLTAIYNTHDAGLLPAVQAELDASNPMVRAAAAMAASAMDRSEAFGSLFARVKSEPDSWARAAMIDGMGKLNHRSDEAFTMCVDMVRSERNTQVRMSLARYLVDNLSHYPASRSTLEEIMNDQGASSQLRDYLVKNMFRSKSTSRRSMQNR